MNPSRFLDCIRIGAQLAVGEQPKCPPGYCAGVATCNDLHCPGRGKTGRPAPDLMQDDHRPLFRWFASKPDARRLVRERAAELEADAPPVTAEQTSNWAEWALYAVLVAISTGATLLWIYFNR